MDVERKLGEKRLARTVLEAEHDADELWEDEEDQRLQRQIGRLEERVGEESTVDDGNVDEGDGDKRDANGIARAVGT